MKIKSSDLEQIAGLTSQYPEANRIELAFAGRSNVGKSSFINSVLSRKNLARTSSKPGKTRTVNFYLVNEEFRLVDLPGYGFAQVSKSEKDKWKKIIESYLVTRENLREVFLLVDIRHKPTDQDAEMYKWIIESGFAGYVIATKADKISRGKHQAAVAEISKKLEIKNKKLIIPFSSETKYGLEKVYDLMDSLIYQEEIEERADEN